MNATYKIGDPVLVIGRICTVKTCIGLFGYVSNIYESGDLALTLLSHPSLEAKNDVRAEKHGRFDTWHASAKPNDLRPLTDVKRVARVEALKAHEMAAPKRERDPRIAAITAKHLSPEGIAKRKQDEADIAAETERIGQVFKLPGVIKRGDKSKFPAYRHPDVEAISRELMGYADAGPSGCTLTELARWKQCLAATDATSFWSGRDEARAVVREFDLDPMTDGHGDALWRRRGSVYVPNGELRDVIIRLWNMGAAILGIDDMEDKDTCWGYCETGEPKGFSVEFAFRRRLPVSSEV